MKCHFLTTVTHCGMVAARDPFAPLHIVSVTYIVQTVWQSCVFHHRSLLFISLLSGPSWITLPYVCCAVLCGVWCVCTINLCDQTLALIFMEISVVFFIHNFEEEKKYSIFHLNFESNEMATLTFVNISIPYQHQISCRFVSLFPFHSLPTGHAETLSAVK